MTARPMPRVLALASVLVVVLATAALCAPGRALAFPEETETQGEIATDLNGVWLLVHHLKFDRPTPKPTPGEPPPPTTRIFNVINLVKITHLGKEEAQKIRAARAAKEQASVAKAEAIVAKRAAEQGPKETKEGIVEGAAGRVIVPQIPRPPGYDPKIHSGDKVEISLLDVVMPETVQQAFQAAQKAETAYEPTDKELALLGSTWGKLKPVDDTEYSRIEWKIVTPVFYDQGLQVDPKLANTEFAITGTQAMIPRPGQPNRNIVVYGVREATDGRLSGTHARAMMASAPFPIPIEMGGTFEMFKVADLPGASKERPKADAAPSAPKKADTAPEKAGASKEQPGS